MATSGVFWRSGWRRRAVVALVLLLALSLPAGALFWWKFLKEGEQAFASEVERFNHGSLGGELVAGIPYPIFMVLPRVFPDLVARHAGEGYGPDKRRHGGYGAFGVAWDPGQRLPAGLSVKRRGFERVTITCALCHTSSYRLTAEGDPQFAVGGPAHSLNLQGLLRFLFAAANDRRFTGARLLPEIALQFDLDPLDYALYQFVLIPKTRWALQFAESQLGWMETRPDWGPGRDDAFNLPKFVLTQSPWDDTVGNTDFPALWRMGGREGHLLHWGGEAQTVAAVTATSALGTGALPGAAFEARTAWLDGFMSGLEPPPFPGPIDAAQAAKGEALFTEHCAVCHGDGGQRTGTAIPLAEVGTDPEHVRTWDDADAARMNRLTGALGMEVARLQAAQGYVARPLVGVWLLAPYLHNGSVPTLRDLLTPPSRRPALFFRGYDLLDLEKVGFVATGPEAEARGWRYDTSVRGNGNGGHAYGTLLREADKAALIEFLKTL